jgi:hypothetical protein
MDIAAAKDEAADLTHLPDWAEALANKHRPNWVLPVCDYCDNEVWPCETRMAWEEAAAAHEALQEAQGKLDAVTALTFDHNHNARVFIPHCPRCQLDRILRGTKEDE